MHPLSARNPRAKRLARLVRQRSLRAEEGVFVVEGPVLLADALASRLVVAEVFVDAPAADRPDVVAAVGAAEAAGATAYLVDDGLARLTDTVTPNALAAIVRRPDPPPAADGETLGEWLRRRAADAGAEPLVLVLVEVSDPGNAGTLLRTAEAAGVHLVVFAGHAVDPWSPKCVRASAGAVFRVPVLLSPDVAAVLDQLGAAGLARMGTRVDAPAARAYDHVDATGPTALVLGNEAHGLSPAADERLDTIVTIPMVGRTESLNVAMAGAVLCFEALRQRRETDLSHVPTSEQGSPQ